MGAKKRKKNKTANYLISRDQRVKKMSDAVLGKVRSNFMGTEFIIYDDGKNPKDKDIRGENEVRRELGAVTYAANVQGNGPRRMQVVVPNPQDPTDFIDTPDGHDSIFTRLKEGSTDGVVHGYNKPPSYDSERGCFTINFNGRVKMASVKNFQLVHEESTDHIMLQFGRIAKDTFNVDIRYPMSPLQAFAICLTSLDSKIATD